MKNQIFGLLLICIFFIGCTKQEMVAPVESSVNSNLLARDSNFIKILEQEKQLTRFINQLAIEKGLTIVELQNKLQYLHDKDLHSGSGDQILYAFLGEANVNYMSSYIKKYRQNLQSLNHKYTYISIQDIDSAVKQVYQNEFNFPLVNTSSMDIRSTNAYLEVNKEKDCGWKYTICIAGATSAAIFCHIGCIGSTAGIGAPVCVILCGTIQAAAGLVCIDNYCPLPE
jgi:hypothetical protein